MKKNSLAIILAMVMLIITLESSTEVRAVEFTSEIEEQNEDVTDMDEDSENSIAENDIFEASNGTNNEIFSDIPDIIDDEVVDAGTSYGGDYRYWSQGESDY